MKKVLFATTALVATAGFASAEVALSGSAQMGVQGGDGQVTQFVQDIDVTFTMSGESDGGITFGAAVDLDESAGSVGTDDAGVAIFISGDFGTLTMGDTDGALDWAMQEAAVGNAGSINDNETGHAGYLGSYADGAYDGQILRYDYSFADFAVAVSIEMDDTDMRDPGYAIGARYTFSFSGGSVTVGGGYQVVDMDAATTFDPGNLDGSELIGDDIFEDAGELTVVGVSAAATLDNGLSAGIAYTVFEGPNNADTHELTHIGIGAGYTFDAITVSANYGMWDIDSTFGPYDGWSATGFGLAAAYDLGGGLSAHIGYGSEEYDRTGFTDSSWSFGLNMAF